MMVRPFLWLCWILFASALAQNREEEILRTPQGPVRGFKDPEGGLFVYYGIPYATAPTGPLKFTAPLPPPAWLQTLDAVDKGIICPQASMGEFNANKNTKENCLIANVYVPDTNEKKLPVVVYVHGGAYQIGFGELITYKNLSRSKKVIVVTFNYRLGAHGFLCLGTTDAPGNAGMKDQVALLRWVNKNIESYGGNPRDVTIAGGSAGSSAVDLLMLSKSTRGLFNKIIPESGGNLAPFSIQSNPLENAKYFAKSLGFENVDDVYALEEFYKSTSLDILTADAFFNHTDNTFVFSPCVERNAGNEPFLIDSPYNILKDGKYVKVPILYGFANMEGLFRAPVFDDWKNKMNEDFLPFLPPDLDFISEEEKQEVANKIKQFYFGDKPLTEASILPYIDYFTDTTFAYPMLRAVKLHVKAGHDKIYLYEYSFVDEAMPSIQYTNNLRGADHCAQSMAIGDGFYIGQTYVRKLSKEYKQVKDVMREIWHNFITTGTPVPSGSSLPEWPATGENGSPHMSLGRTLELRGSLLEDRMNFWHEIYDQHYRYPMPPPNPPARHSEL